MPFKRPNAKGGYFENWWISYYTEHGGQVKQSSGTTSKRKATQIELEARNQADNIKKGTIEHLAESVLLTYLEDTPNKKSHDRDLFSVANLSMYFTGKTIQSLESRHYAEYRRQRYNGEIGKPSGEWTVRKELLLLSRSINHCKSEYGWSLPNTVKGNLPSPPPASTDWFTVDEITLLLTTAQASKRNRTFIDWLEVSLNTGMRPGETMHMEIDRIDLANRVFYLKPDDNKTELDRSVPINDRVREVVTARLREFKPKRYLFEGKDSKRMLRITPVFRRMCEKSGVKYRPPKTVRHTAASWLVQNGTPLPFVQMLLGHKDIRTTMRYVHLSPDHAREATDSLTHVPYNVPCLPQKTAKKG